MALKLDDRPETNDYDDGDPGWYNKGLSDKLDDQYKAPAATDEDLPEGHPSRKSLSPSDLQSAEDEAETGAGATNVEENEAAQVAGDDEDSKFNYRNEKRKAKVKGWRKRPWLIFGGLGGLSLLALVAILLFLASTLKIQNLAQHILEYNMVSVSRSFSAGVEDNVTEKLAADTSEESFVASLKSKLGANYADFRSATWGKLDTFRPQKVIDNLQADSKLQFVYDEVPRKILPGTKLDLKALRIDGQDVSIADLKTGRYFSNLDERVRFSSQLEASLEQALPDTPSIIRSRVAQQIRDELGIKLQWWEKLGKGYAGRTEEEAFKLQQKEAFKTISEPAVSDCATPEICSAAKQSADELAAKVQDGTAAETDLGFVKAQASGAISEADQEARSTILQAIRNATEQSAVATATLGAIKTLSGYYNVALPVCIVYDGSITQSRSTVDAKSAANVRTFYGIESAADQQRSGDTTAAAVGATNDKLGNIANTVPELRASGKSINTVSFVGPADQPQNGGLGEINSIANVFFGNGAAASFMNAILSHCSQILDLRVAGTVAFLQIVAAILTGGGSGAAEADAEVAASAGATALGDEVAGSTAAELAAEEAASATGQTVTNQAVKTLTDKAKDLLLKVGKDTVKIGGLTLLAKLLVVSKMSANTTGLETDGSFANRGDIGGNLHANDLHREALGGRTLTPTEVAESRLADQKDLATTLKKESFSQRYLAMDNSDSLVANFSFRLLGFWDSFRSNQTVFFSQILSNIGSIFTLNGTLASNLLSNKKVEAAASQTGNYGIVQWGWTNDELALINSDPSYKPIVNAELYARNPQKTDIENKYSKCFTNSMGTLLASGDVVKALDGSISGTCSPDNLGVHNSQFGDGVFRYRLSKRNDFILDHLNDLQASSQTTTAAATP